MVVSTLEAISADRLVAWIWDGEREKVELKVLVYGDAKGIWAVDGAGKRRRGVRVSALMMFILEL